MALVKMRCLKIDEKWVNLILSGKKTWEIRRTNTIIRERIALGNKKIKRCVGYATIVDSLEKSLDELEQYSSKHQANDFLRKYAKGRDTLYAWVLDDIEVEPEPDSRLYSYSRGCWCKI